MRIREFALAVPPKSERIAESILPPCSQDEERAAPTAATHQELFNRRNP